ncbi:hypothetical protein HDV02_002938 [Globomyces sp. JEL0801]|nr:hypothetical protein HDV02_002938 [Globomyces sp. JEL0801]
MSALPKSGQESGSLQLIATISGTIGMLGVFGCFMIFYFNKNELKAPMGRFLIAYFIADFLNSAAKSFGQIPYKNGETSFACQAQAATIVCSKFKIH